MKIKFSLFTFIVVIWVNPLFGQYNPSEIISSYFQNLEKGSEDIVAIDNIYKTAFDLRVTASSDSIRYEIAQQRKAFKKLRKQAGKYYGYTIIYHSLIGDCINYYEAIARFHGLPVKFTFVFYQPIDKWKLYHFSFEAVNIQKESWQSWKDASKNSVGALRYK